MSVQGQQFNSGQTAGARNLVAKYPLWKSDLSKITPEDYNLLSALFPEAELGTLEKGADQQLQSASNQAFAAQLSKFQEKYPESKDILKHVLGLDTWDPGTTKYANVLIIRMVEAFQKNSDTLDLSQLEIDPNHFPPLGMFKERLKVLYLSSNNFKAVPEEILDLTHLTALDVSNNQLSELPASIERLTKLEELDVGSNKLTSLPNEIRNLKKLSFIDYSNNQITEDPQLKNSSLNLIISRDNPYQGKRLKSE